MKKVLALALALVMVFTLSISAFAANNGTATLKVSYFGVELLDETVTLTAGMTAKDVMDEYAELLELEWKQVENLNPYFGDYAYAVDEIYSTGSEPLGSQSDETADYWSTSYPGYGVEYSETVDGQIIYHFIYVGNDWKFTVNGSKPLDSRTSNPTYELYMDQYTVQAGDAIVVNYEKQVERWTGTTNWLAGT